MRRFITTVLCLVCINFWGQVKAQTYHRVKIHYTSPDEFQQLLEAGFPLDHGIHKYNHFFESDFSETEIASIESLGYEVELIKPDIKAFYKNQNDPGHTDYRSVSNSRNATCLNGNSDYQTPTNFNVWPANSYGGFYTYSQVLQELDDMANLYPNLITLKADISNFTTEGTPNAGTTPPIGGNKIQWVKISDNPNTDETEPEVLYTAIHHAREPISLSQLLYFMWYLLENYDSDPEIQSIVNNTELYFVPVVNPDGYLYNELTDPTGGGLWRKNRKNSSGADNNRNYDYHINGNPANNTWGGPGSSSNPNSSTYHGTGPFSEVENQAIKWFVEQHDFVLALNNHTFGELLYYPFGYADVPTPDDALYQAFTAELVSQNGYNALSDFPFSGDSDDFMYGTVGTHSKIFAMTPEIGTSFWPAQSSIVGICKEMMYTNLTAAKMVNNYATIENASAVFIQNENTSADYTVQRLGLVDPANFSVSINPISSNILSVGAPNSHNGLNYAQLVNGSINLGLDPGIADGDLIEYELVINNGSYDSSLSVIRVFGQPLLSLDEPANNTSNWNASAWTTTNEEFTSATTSITDSPNSNYSNNTNSIIALTSGIDLSNAIAAYLEFQAKWEIEDNFDYVQVEVSTNNGLSWIPQCGKYTSDGSSNQIGAAGEPVYDGFQSNWVLESINLSDYLGDTILIRFKIISDISVREDGFYFDDLQLKVLEQNLSTDEFQLDGFKIYPNPVADDLRI